MTSSVRDTGGTKTVGAWWGPETREDRRTNDSLSGQDITTEDSGTDWMSPVGGDLGRDYDHGRESRNHLPSIAPGRHPVSVNHPKDRRYLIGEVVRVRSLQN